MNNITDTERVYRDPKGLDSRVNELLMGDRVAIYTKKQHVHLLSYILNMRLLPFCDMHLILGLHFRIETMFCSS